MRANYVTEHAGSPVPMLAALPPSRRRLYFRCAHRRRGECPPNGLRRTFSHAQTSTTVYAMSSDADDVTPPLRLSDTLCRAGSVRTEQHGTIGKVRNTFGSRDGGSRTNDRGNSLDTCSDWSVTTTGALDPDPYRHAVRP